MRTKIQVMADRLLLLYALARGNRDGYVDGTFKLIKIPFMAQLASTKQGANTFNYAFYRWTFGPFTTEIYEDADALVRFGLSTPKSKNPSVTEAGQRLLDMTEELFRHSPVLHFVDQASRECAPLNFTALKRKVYQQVVCVDGLYETTIAQAPRGSNVLTALPHANEGFSLDDDWVDTLWGQFNYSPEDLEIRSIIQSAPLEPVCQ